jgi:hypothetical protein
VFFVEIDRDKNDYISIEYLFSDFLYIMIIIRMFYIIRATINYSIFTDHFANTDNNPYGLPEDNNYLLCDLDKIDYILGFQGEEMIFRNYIF